MRPWCGNMRLIFDRDTRLCGDRTRSRLMWFGPVLSLRRLQTTHSCHDMRSNRRELLLAAGFSALDGVHVFSMIDEGEFDSRLSGGRGSLARLVR